jgi:predicted  nucleic acid-binding Zn-ribbon protein
MRDKYTEIEFCWGCDDLSEVEKLRQNKGLSVERVRGHICNICFYIMLGGDGLKNQEIIDAITAHKIN